MRFVHIADIHFDTPFENLKGKDALREERKKEQTEAFDKVIEYVKNNKIETLFISGDIFEQERVKVETVKYIIAKLEEIKETKVFVAPGNHDPYVSNSPYKMFEWPENVHFFDGEVKKFEYDDIVIYGVGFDKFFVEESIIPDIKIDKTKINILVTHGTLNGGSKKYHDIKDIDLEKFDYCALRTYTYAKNRRVINYISG